MKTLLIVTAALLLVTGLAFAQDSTKTKAETEAKTEAKSEDKTEACEKEKKMEIVTTESGLKYCDLVVGEGKEAVNDMMVECHYTLWLATDKEEKGKMLQSSKDMGKPFPFKVGNPGLIKGWNEGMLGMKEGGTRCLIIPGDLAYGANPPPGSGIPANQTLIFELEFLKAK